jgi:hypothetical protein
MSKPVTVICRYVVKPGKEAAMEALLARHWPTLHAAGLVTDEPAQAFRGVAASAEKEHSHGAGHNVYVEIYAWKDEGSSNLAHQSPQVMAVWEPMGDCCEHMEFPHFERVLLPPR